MSYRKFRADYLFTGYQLLDNSHVLITNERGQVQNLLPVSEVGDDIETHTGILCPGFINCHCHLELSHLKGVIPSGSGMVNFLLQVLQHRNFPKEQVIQAIDKAEREMLYNGIVAVGDICNTTDTIEFKKQGLLFYHNFIEAAGFIEATAPQRFADYRSVFEQFAKVYALPVESISIVPHAPYSVSPALFNLIAHFPGNHLLTMHNQESVAENDFFQTGTGDLLKLFESLQLDISFYAPPRTSSLQASLPHFLPNQSVILVHNCHTTQADLDSLLTIDYSQLACRTGRLTTHLCLCPNANEYIGNPLPDVDLFRRNNASIVIGTDSLASNNQLSIAAELKTIQQHFPHIETAELLQWATLNGAKAMEMDNLLGSFEPGKQPGVLVVEEDFSSVKRLV
jgi:aminodeoxyfutalosine deaminase